MKKEPLFDLIKSMTGLEKRYFKLYASRHTIGEKNNYLLIYEAVEPLEKYNEEDVKQSLAKDLKIKNFAVEKNYLYRLILKSLNSYNRNTSITGKLREKLLNIEILFNKKHYTQALKIVAKTKQAALEYEKYKLLIELIDWQMRIKVVAISTWNLKGEHEELIKENEGYLHTLINISEFQNLRHQTYLNTSASGQLRREEKKKKVEEILSNKLLQSEENASSIKAKIWFYEIKAVGNYFLGNLEESFLSFKKSLEMTEKSIVYSRDNPLNYLSTLNNYLVICISIGNEEEYELTINKVKKLEKAVTNEDLKSKVFFTRYINETNNVIRRKKYAEMEAVAEGLSSELAIHESNTEEVRKHILFYNLAGVYMNISQPKMALRWVNKVLNTATPKSRADLVVATRILALMIHFELGNIDYLENSTKQTRRILKKGDLIHQFEEAFLKFFESAVKDNTREEVKKCLAELQLKLQKLENDPLEKNALRYFDYFLWVDSQIQGVPIAKLS